MEYYLTFYLAINLNIALTFHITVKFKIRTQVCFRHYFLQKTKFSVSYYSYYRTPKEKIVTRQENLSIL